MKDSPYLDPKSRIKEFTCRLLLFGIPTATLYRYSNYRQCQWLKKVNFLSTLWGVFLELVPENVF